MVFIMISYRKLKTNKKAHQHWDTGRQVVGCFRLDCSHNTRKELVVVSRLEAKTGKAASILFRQQQSGYAAICFCDDP